MPSCLDEIRSHCLKRRVKAKEIKEEMQAIPTPTMTPMWLPRMEAQIQPVWRRKSFRPAVHLTVTSSRPMDKQHQQRKNPSPNTTSIKLTFYSDAANFINFCNGQTLTTGLQKKTGSCNGIDTSTPTLPSTGSKTLIEKQ
jgi:hypothetical protein